MTDNDIILTIVLTTLVILLLVAGIVITIFIAGRRQMQQQAQMATLQADYEKELRTVASEVQEQVMANVAGELHDNIGQLLTSMHLQMEYRRADDPAFAATMQPLGDTLAHTIDQVKLLGKSLNNDQLQYNGLRKTIEMEVGRLQHLRHFALHWENDGAEPHLTADQRLMSFRIFQEVLNNAMKHSQARNINIELKGDNDAFMLQVADDGRGFDVEKAYGGSGLRNISKRAAMAGLVLTITSQTGKGSIFTLQRQITQTQ